MAKKTILPPRLIEVEGQTLYLFPSESYPYQSVKLTLNASKALGFKRRVSRSGWVSLHQVYKSGGIEWVKVLTLADSSKYLVPDSTIKAKP